MRAWASRHENVVDTDLVLYVQFGLQHATRAEDFPVMPCEIIQVAMKPSNFFERNPAIDVPPSRQEVNRSVVAGEVHRQPMVEAVVGGKGEVCCSSKL